MSLENFGGHICGLIILLFLDYHRYQNLSIIIALPLGFKGCVDWLEPDEVVHFEWYSLWVSIVKVMIAIIDLSFVVWDHLCWLRDDGVFVFFLVINLFRCAEVLVLLVLWGHLERPDVVLVAEWNGEAILILIPIKGDRHWRRFWPYFHY